MIRQQQIHFADGKEKTQNQKRQSVKSTQFELKLGIMSK